MEKIESVELYHVNIPLKEPFFPSWIPGYPQTHNRGTLLRVRTSSGIEGISAGVAHETEREGLGCLLGPYILGMDATNIPVVRQRLREASYLGWRNPWVEAAFWDIRAKIAGRPLYQLLQQEAERVERLPVYASLGEVRPFERRRNDLESLVARGFRAVKLRVHAATLEEDIRLLQSVGKFLEGRLALMVDANMGWPVSLIKGVPQWDLDRATAFARACEEFSVKWLEEPLDMHAYDDLAALRQRTSTPIAGGEMNSGWHEYRVMLEKGCLDIYQPDATLSCGISDILRVMEACREQGLKFCPHTWTNGIGVLINMHLYAAWGQEGFLEYPYDPPGWIPACRDGILSAPVEVSDDGTVPVPQVPGIGVQLDEKALRKFGKRFYKATPFRLAVHTIRQKGLRTAMELKRARENP
jgi:L-alanine-DL-glutamate epimerase-like enolase superfamily enzyme